MLTDTDENRPAGDVQGLLRDSHGQLPYDMADMVMWTAPSYIIC